MCRPAGRLVACISVFTRRPEASKTRTWAGLSRVVVKESVAPMPPGAGLGAMTAANDTPDGDASREGAAAAAEPPVTTRIETLSVWKTSPGTTGPSRIWASSVDPPATAT